jgi:hypothetical protein
MPRHAHLGLAVLGAALAVPASARSGDDYPASAAPVPAVVSSTPTPGAVPLDHKHYGRVKRGLVPCEKCMAAAKAGKLMVATPPLAPAQHVHVAPAQTPIPAAGFPEGSRIVACAHSSNGVCATCKALLELPGQVVSVAPGMPAGATMASAAPGRAVATDAAPGRAVVASGEPEPIGVMRTNYSANAPARSAAAPKPPMPHQPGHTPFLGEQHETNPHILGHLFGISAMQRDFQDKLAEPARKKKEKHAAISYEPTGGKVEDLPASMVYGRGAPR